MDIGQQLLGEIVSERQESDLDTAEQPQDTGPCRGKIPGTGDVDQFTQVKDLVTIKASGNIHGSDLPFI